MTKLYCTYSLKEDNLQWKTTSLLKVEYFSNHCMDCNLWVLSGKLGENPEEILSVALLRPACLWIFLNAITTYNEISADCLYVAHNIIALLLHLASLGSHVVVTIISILELIYKVLGIDWRCLLVFNYHYYIQII